MVITGRNALNAAFGRRGAPYVVFGPKPAARSTAHASAVRPARYRTEGMLCPFTRQLADEHGSGDYSRLVGMRRLRSEVYACAAAPAWLCGRAAALEVASCVVCGRSHFHNRYLVVLMTSNGVMHPTLIPALRRAQSRGDQLAGAAADALEEFQRRASETEVKPRKFDAYCTEPAFVLATLALQSERYGSDADFRDATDAVLFQYGVPGPGRAPTQADVDWASSQVKTKPEPKGHVIRCDECDASVTLPYTDERRLAVLLGPCQGWTFPPVRCPSCSSRNGEAKHG